MRKSLLTLLTLIACLSAYASDYYGRHYILVVDQTQDVQSYIANAADKLYTFLQEAFVEGKSSELQFNPATDEISLYVFALEGACKEDKYYTGAYRDIKMASGYDNKVRLFDDNFIQSRGSFTSSGKSIKDYFKDVVYPLFHNLDPKAEAIKEVSAVTFSKYVYPGILNPKYLNFSKPAKDNYLLFVTNYQSGMDDHGASEDHDKLEALIGKENVKSFEKRIDEFGEPFYLLPMKRIIRTGMHNGHEKEVMINPNLLMLKSQTGNSVYIVSNLGVKQRDYQSHDYKISPVEISFNHDDNTMHVDSIVMTVAKGDKTLYAKEILGDTDYDNARKTYTIPGSTLNLGADYDPGDNLDFSYVFYGRAIGDDGSTIMPLVYVTDREFTFTSDNLVSFNESNKFMWEVIGVLAVLAGILAAIFIPIYKQRGRNRRVSFRAQVRPISNERYMEVSNNEVKEYDCWYWAEGDPTSTNINVKFEWRPADLKFAQKYDYIVMARVQDIDNNEDFTFKPDQTILKPDGSPYTVQEWFPVTDMESFNIVAYVDPAYRLTPNFSRENILRMKVEIAIMRVEGDKTYTVRDWAKEYSFIVRPKIKNSNLWVAFDPGTSGSCIAYGVAEGPQSNSDMEVAENMSETIQGAERFSTIFPSKIRLNNKSKRLFGDGSIVAEELVEGDEADFTFGNGAEIMWARNGVNCFQSIKKLLGYKDKLPIKGYNGEEREISGQDLAHLLVKGLCNHFEEYLTSDSSHVNPEIKEQFVGSDKSILSRRAIVAVPNSYTLVKIQDMVDSVKRTGRFEEVHYIFESEAAFMMYLRDKWGSELLKLQNRVFIVYDMGGATINITALKIEVHNCSDGNIDYIDVNTIAKIGYVIGGDDIDFALIQLIYGLPTVKRALELLGEKVDEHQIKNKEALLKFVRNLKLQIIDYANKKTGSTSSLVDATVLYGEIKSMFKNEIKLDIEDYNDEVGEYLKDQETECAHIEEFVLSNVRDAISELLNMLNAQGKGGAQVEIIFSGRSTLYPRVKETVFNQIEKSGFYASEEWQGFYENGEPSAELVKTAVARGACWYAMYSTRIHLHHNILTSNFGFIDIVDNKETFIPLATVGEKFDEDHGDINTEPHTPGSTLSVVKFVQMLGNNYDEIWDREHNGKNKIKHKYNLLDMVQQNEITSVIKNIVVKIDNKNNFSYVVTLVTGKKITTGAFSGREVRMDIAKEESPAYIFATKSVLTVDSTATDDTVFGRRGGSGSTTSRGGSSTSSRGTRSGGFIIRDNDKTIYSTGSTASRNFGANPSEPRGGRSRKF